LEVLLNRVRWQETQAVGKPAYCPLLWQAEHCWLEWAPVSGKPVVLWLKELGAQAAVL
jgi:hypothetical protein